MASEGFAAPWVEFEKHVGFRPLIHGPTYENLMKEWGGLGAGLVKALTFPGPDTSFPTEDRTIDNGIKIRIYTPPGYVKGSKPVGIYIHGGGWAMGDLDSDEAFVKPESKGADAVLVSIDYRLAPEFKYPAGLDDCVSGFKWTLANAVSLGGVPDEVFICGTSAGGGSAFGTALRIIDDGMKDNLAGVVAQVPVTVHPDAVPENLKSKYNSYKEHQEHTVNTKSAMYAFSEIYGAAVDDIYASPLLHPKLADLPKTYISYCGHDTLADDSRLMIEALQKAGVDVKYDEFKGYPHYFWTFPAPQLAEPTRDYLEKVSNGIKYVLS